MGKARTKFELFGYEKTTGPRFLGATSRPPRTGVSAPCRRQLIVKVTQTSKMRFLAPARFTHPPQTIAADGGQRGKKRFVAPAEMTHTLASRRRLLTIHFIAPAENTHTPWQAALPLFFSASPRWIGSRCVRCRVHETKLLVTLNSARRPTTGPCAHRQTPAWPRAP